MRGIDEEGFWENIDSDKIPDRVRRGEACQYCMSDTELVDSAEVYGGKSYGMVRLCPTCKSYVGCHRGTSNAMGRTADPSLRLLKTAAHMAFDGLRKRIKKRSRNQWYNWLAQKMGIPKDFAHIGMFSNSQCKRCIQICDQEHQRLKRRQEDYEKRQNR